MFDNNKQGTEQKINNEQVNGQVEQQVNEQKVQVGAQVEQVNNKVEKEKGRGTFYGIIAFAVFIIMAVGATFAYFTASTNSGEGSLNAGSATMALEFISYESAWLSNKIIPAYSNIVEYSVEKRPTNDAKMCVDDNGREICSLYVFQVKNSDVGDMNVSISLSSNTNDFFNPNDPKSVLYAMLYKIDTTTGYDEGMIASDPDPKFITDQNTGDGDDCDPNNVDNGCIQVKDGIGTDLITGFTPIYVNRLGVQKTLQSVTETTGEGANATTSVVPSIDRQVPLVGEDPVKLNDSVNIPGNGFTTFMIVLYIKDDDTNQNFASGKTFSGNVIVSGLDSAAGGITGRIGGLQKDDFEGLQSNTTTTEATTTETTTEPGP